MNCPLDYGLCNQTVTLYRRRGDTVSRQVVEGASFLYGAEQAADHLGTRRETPFQLIIPGDAQLQPGDRVYDGIGPEEVDWDTFLPVTVPGLVEAEYVEEHRWQGDICHTRAGRR